MLLPKSSGWCGSRLWVKGGEGRVVSSSCREQCSASTLYWQMSIGRYERLIIFLVAGEFGALPGSDIKHSGSDLKRSRKRNDRQANRRKQNCQNNLLALPTQSDGVRS